jgi:hypothetical protein
MGSRRRHDERSIRRRGPTREPKRRILIVCEGEETERGYFKDFQHEVRNPRVHVEVSSETGEPLQVVRSAMRLKKKAEDEARGQRDENLRWDEVWGVVDVDEHASLGEARQLALKNDIDLAISNPCFELWALLHFQEQRAHIERDKAHSALRRHLPGYDKGLDFPKLHPGYGGAVRRAQELDAEAQQQGALGRNPTTGVYRLTESIRKGGSP